MSTIGVLANLRCNDHGGAAASDTVAVGQNEAMYPSIRITDRACLGADLDPGTSTVILRATHKRRREVMWRRSEEEVNAFVRGNGGG